MLLTDQLLLKFQRCSRQAYLEVYGNPEARSQMSDFLQKLGQDRQKFFQSLIAEQSVQRPEYAPNDWQAGFQSTLDLMQKGTPMIRSGVLLSPSPQETLSFLSTPDLLVRQSGVSVFGDWEYIPVDIKISKRPKLEYQLLSAFHAQLLSAVQETPTDGAWLYLREKGWYTVDLPRVMPKLEELLTGLAEMLQSAAEPEVFIARNRCSLCVWFAHCYAEAQAQNHLSLLPGVTPTRYPILQAHQLSSVEALANTDPIQLHAKTGLGRDISSKLVAQASAFVDNEPIFLPDALNLLDIHGFPTAPIELYFDIEAEPSLNLIYLHGVLVVDRQRDTQVFHPFLALTPDDEEQAWQSLLELLQRYPDAPIFHFCSYEVQSVKRLGSLYSSPPEVIAALVPRFVDLHEWVTLCVTLPIESYTLKLIARWLGFEWRNSEANGAQAICWYSQWLETGDRQVLDEVVLYNEDDCLATYHVKDWLALFLQQQAEQHLPPLAAGF